MKTLRTIVIVVGLMTCWSILVGQTYNVLHYTETTGFNHNTKAVSFAMFNGFALPGYNITDSNSSAPFDTCYTVNANGDTMLNFDVIIWSNTSGCNGLDPNQRAMFQDWVKAGGSCIVIHAGFDTYRHSSANGNCTGNFDFYAEHVAGGSVQQSPNHTKNNYAGVIVSVVSHVTQTLIPNPWNKLEEYYYWENGYLNPNFTTIMQVQSTGSKSYDAQRMVVQIHENAWCGRMFATSLGHNKSNFQTDTDFQQLLLNALMWVAGDPCATGFGILDDLLSGGAVIPLQQAEIEEGYIYTDQTEIVRQNPFYEVWTLQGKLIYQGFLDSQGRIELISSTEPLLYRTYSQQFKVMKYEW